MTWTDDLATARDNAATILAELTVSPKPTYDVHGHSYSWNEYQAMLTKQIDDINRLLAQAGPFEIVSQG